jgi:putative tricarboxylic transport membrane protein
MKKADFLLGGATVALGAAVYLYTLSFPSMADGAPGPALFPRILSGLLFLFGGILMLQSWRGGAQDASAGYGMRASAKVVAILVSIAIYIAVVMQLGFVLTSLALLLFIMTLLGVRMRVAIPTTVGVIIFCLLLFGRLLRVPLPPGILGFY